MANASAASVIGATLANFAISAAKLLAATAGGSSAMMSESIHSFVDGVNDLLLLLGLKRSRRAPDEHHPFGYGKELYFWALIVSCSVFAVGGAVSVIEGVNHLRHPEEVQHALWAYLALAAGVVFDAISLVYGLVQFRKQNRDKRFREALREAKDPSTTMVLFEDSAAVLGEVIAAGGILAGQMGFRYGDGIASILIGLLLAAVGVVLIMDNRDLIVGEGVDDDIAASIRELAVGEGKFREVRAAHTMHFGPDDVLVTIEGVFDANKSAGELMQAIDRIQEAIRERHPAVKFIYIDPETGQKHQSGSRFSDPGQHKAA
jgi:cation diffusion facilitator family transporter